MVSCSCNPTQLDWPEGNIWRDLKYNLVHSWYSSYDEIILGGQSVLKHQIIEKDSNTREWCVWLGICCGHSGWEWHCYCQVNLVALCIDHRWGDRCCRDEGDYRDEHHESCHEINNKRGTDNPNKPWKIPGGYLPSGIREEIVSIIQIMANFDKEIWMLLRFCSDAIHSLISMFVTIVYLSLRLSLSTLPRNSFCMLKSNI